MDNSCTVTLFSKKQIAKKSHSVYISFLMSSRITKLHYHRTNLMSQRTTRSNLKMWNKTGHWKFFFRGTGTYANFRKCESYRTALIDFFLSFVLFEISKTKSDLLGSSWQTEYVIVAVGLITPLQLPGPAAEGSSSTQPPGYSLATATGPGSRKKNQFASFSISSPESVFRIRIRFRIQIHVFLASRIRIH